MLYRPLIFRFSCTHAWIISLLDLLRAQLTNTSLNSECHILPAEVGVIGASRPAFHRSTTFTLLGPYMEDSGPSGVCGSIWTTNQTAAI